MRSIVCFAALMLISGATSAAVGNAAQASSFKDGVSSTGWIDFIFANGKSVLVPAKVNGQEVFVKLIDGADTSYIDKDFAASLGLKPAAVAKGGANVDVQVQIGALTLRGVKSSVVSLSATHADHPFVPFILSDDLFNQAIVDIDFAHHRVAFENPGIVIALPPDAVKIPLVKRLDSLTVPVSIEGGTPVPFEWYLGDPAPITVYEPYYEAHQLLQNRASSIRLGGGLGGQRPQEPIATLNHIQFAGVVFSQVPSVFPSNAVRGSDSPLISGNIGLALLSRFRLIVDYPHQRLYVTPYAAVERAPFAKDRLGLYLSKQSTYFIVDFVSPSSPAYAAGFRAGERIAAINQKPSRDWDSAELAKLSSASSGSVIVFTMGNGNQRQVKTLNYF